MAVSLNVRYLNRGAWPALATFGFPEISHIALLLSFQVTHTNHLFISLETQPFISVDDSCK